MKELSVLSQLSPRILRALENDVQALHLRLEGRTFEEIALALGYRSKSSAWKAVDRARTARLVELGRLVQRLNLADTTQRLAAIERRIETLNKNGHGKRC
jgi:hypothetical protein